MTTALDGMPLRFSHLASHTCSGDIGEDFLGRLPVGWCISKDHVPAEVIFDASERLHTHVWMLNVDGGWVHARNWTAPSAITEANLLRPTACQLRLRPPSLVACGVLDTWGRNPPSHEVSSLVGSF